MHLADLGEQLAGLGVDDAAGALLATGGEGEHAGAGAQLADNKLHITETDASNEH